MLLYQVCESSVHGQHGLTAHEKHEAYKQISNHSISELLKKDNPLTNEKPAAYNVTNIFMVGSNLLNKSKPYHDVDRGRRGEILNEDVMMARSNSFEGDRIGVFQSPEYSYHSTRRHHDEYNRRAVTPSLPPAGIGYPSLLMSTAPHGDTRQRSKYTCRSAGSTPLSSPGPILEKPSFFAERYMCRGSDHDNGTRSNPPEFRHDRKIGFEDTDSYGNSGPTSTSPSKSFLKKHRDDGMERLVLSLFLSLLLLLSLSK